MKVAIHQPCYFPWMGYFHKLLSCDLFVYLDTVQFTKNNWQNRNKLQGNNGKEFWITVPVKQHLGQRICDVMIADCEATQRHYKSLMVHYAHTDGFMAWTYELFTHLLGIYHFHMSDLAILSTNWIWSKLTNDVGDWRLASELGNFTSTGSKLVADICKSVGADTYLAGSHTPNYADPNDFRDAGISVMLQTIHSDLPPLSMLHYLLHSPLKSRKIVESFATWEPWELQT